MDFNNGSNKSAKCKIKVIKNSAVYTKELMGHLPQFYYLMGWKSYPKENI